MVCSYRGVIAWIAALSGLSVVQLEASSWPEEFVQRYEAHGLALLHTNEADWVQRTNEYMGSDARHGLARFLSIGHLTYGVKWAQCTGLLFQSPSF